MTYTVSSLRQQLALRLLTGQKRSKLAQGFTLVELLVVIVVIGILAAVALPQFLGVRDRASLNTQIGEASGLAKECAGAVISESNLTSAQTPNTGLTYVGSVKCGGTATGDTSYTTTKGSASNVGAKCGSAVTTASNKNCKITVNDSTGQIVYALAS